MRLSWSVIGLARVWSSLWKVKIAAFGTPLRVMVSLEMWEKGSEGGGRRRTGVGHPGDLRLAGAEEEGFMAGQDVNSVVCVVACHNAMGC